MIFSFFYLPFYVSFFMLPSTVSLCVCTVWIKKCRELDEKRCSAVTLDFLPLFFFIISHNSTLFFWTVSHSYTLAWRESSTFWKKTRNKKKKFNFQLNRKKTLLNRNRMKEEKGTFIKFLLLKYKKKSFHRQFFSVK